MRVAATALLAVASCAFAGCGGGGPSGTTLTVGPTITGFELTGGTAVVAGMRIDPRFTCDGANVSPRIEWMGVPDGTRELALAIEDPDAPGGTFTHWLVYGLDASASGLSEGAVPAAEGTNDFGDVGYGGPCPPDGQEHHYVFRLLALDSETNLEPGAHRAAFDEAVAPHLLGEARLIARYARA